MSFDVWVFGYGSLIFRADFPFAERRVARLRGFARRFWQRSPDHRGTPLTPGRVVTLVVDPSSCVLGVAYRIEGARADSVLAALDLRERAGYERLEVEIEFIAPDAGRARALVYFASRANPDFSEESNQAIAVIVRAASGPSGDNASYVRSLARALRELGENDAHVFEIERLLDEPS